MPPQDFELMVAEWEELMGYADHRSWIGVLKHLVERASAKAFYHARQRLVAKLGRDVADEEERLWQTARGIEHALRPQDLFLKHFTTVPKTLRLAIYRNS